MAYSPCETRIAPQKSLLEASSFASIVRPLRSNSLSLSVRSIYSVGRLAQKPHCETRPRAAHANIFTAL